ncbi:NAD-dependent epimerase/dehydratase family protein [Actinoplanes sp. NPDC049681]|uniref:NAD-dependent epimerase/dehydratase family protein n=1 Tax=Actinoplanes sp. NPDC049681 TaxID=3363905 RepID=UPI0037A70582
MRVVVTGGAGFIGANLCRELIMRPAIDEVIVLDNLSTGYEENLRGVDVEFVNGSMLDRPLLQEVIAGADTVIHLAARPSVPRSIADPIASHEANATGTLYVLEECRRAGASIVVASSSSVYGSVPELPRREDLPTRPQSPYAASKLAGESYALAYGNSFGLSALVFRFFNVYGPLQSSGHAYAAVIPAFIHAALSGSPLRIHGDGTQTRDFTYVGSVVKVLADAATRRVSAATPVNLAFGSRISLLEIKDRLEVLLDRTLDVSFEPTRQGDVRDSQAASRVLLDLFPDCDPVPFEDGLELTLKWYQEHLNVEAAGLAASGGNGGHA